MPIVFYLTSYGCESWTIKEAKHIRIDAFELRFWRRLLRALWTARSSQSILNEINPEYLLARLMGSWSSNTLTTWCEKSTHWKRHWCWERLRAEEAGDRGRDGWMVSPTQWTRVWVNSGSWWGTGRPGVLQSMVTGSWTRLSNWTEVTGCPWSSFFESWVYASFFTLLFHPHQKGL